MTAIHPTIRTLFAVPFLALCLAACGGDSSGDSSGGSGRGGKDLTLNEDTQFLAIATVAHNLGGSLEVSRWLSHDALQYRHPECNESNVDVVVDGEEPEATSWVVTYTNCRFEWAGSSGFGLEETLSWEINGQISGTRSLEGSLSIETYEYDRFEFQERWTASHDSDEGEGGRFFEAHGALTFTRDDMTSTYTSDHLSFMLRDTWTYREGGVETSSGDQPFQLEVQDLAFTMLDSDTYQSSGQITVFDGGHKLELEGSTPIPWEHGYVHYPCMEGGELDISDAEGNTLSVLFNGHLGVNLTLNGVGSSYTCEAFEGAIAPYLYKNF